MVWKNQDHSESQTIFKFLKTLQQQIFLNSHFFFIFLFFPSHYRNTFCNLQPNSFDNSLKRNIFSKLFGEL